MAYVPMTRTYWITGRNNKLVAFDPRAPANISEYIKDANQLNNFNVTMLYTPPCTDLVMAATKDRHIVIWNYNSSGAYRYT